MLNNIPPALIAIPLIWIIRGLSKRANKNIQAKPECENFMSRFFQVDVINDRALLDKDEIVAMTRIYHEISYVSPPELDENGWPKRVPALILPRHIRLTNQCQHSGCREDGLEYYYGEGQSAFVCAVYKWRGAYLGYYFGDKMESAFNFPLTTYRDTDTSKLDRNQLMEAARVYLSVAGYSKHLEKELIEFLEKEGNDWPSSLPKAIFPLRTKLADPKDRHANYWGITVYRAHPKFAPAYWTCLVCGTTVIKGPQCYIGVGQLNQLNPMVSLFCEYQCPNVKDPIHHKKAGEIFDAGLRRARSNPT